MFQHFRERKDVAVIIILLIMLLSLIMGITDIPRHAGPETALEDKMAINPERQ